MLRSPRPSLSRSQQRPTAPLDHNRGSTLDRGRRTPAKETVEIWTIDLHAWERDLGQLGVVLDGAERARIERLRPDLRAPFIVAHAALRQVLSWHLEVPAASIRFTHAAHGKPLIEGSSLGFSLSHSGDLAVCAVAAGPIGVDIEVVRHLPDAGALVRRFFARAEAAAYASLPDVHRPHAFFAMWTQKEALLKATGEGLSRSLDSLEIARTELGELIACVDGRRVDHQWSIRSFEPCVGYVGSIAYSGRISHVVLRAWAELGSHQEQTTKNTRLTTEDPDRER